MSESNSGWFTVLGVAMILAGIVAIGTPYVAAFAVNIFIGWTLVFVGIAEIVHTFSSPGWGGFLWELMVGVLTAFAGFFMIFNPVAGVLTLTLILAFSLVFRGILKIMLGMKLRPAPGSGMIIAGGIIALLLGALIYSEWPSGSAQIIGIIIGVNLLVDGIGMISHGGAESPAAEAA